MEILVLHRHDFAYCFYVKSVQNGLAEFNYSLLSIVFKKSRPMLFPKSEVFSNKFEYFFFLIVNLNSFPTC